MSQQPSATVVNEHATAANARLMAAAHGGDAELLGRLLDLGAGDPLAPNSQGRTPLMMAAVSDRVECVSLLIPRSEMEATDNEKNTALMLALQGNSDRCAAELLSAGKANPNTANVRGTTPLDVACSRGNAESIRLLLDAGVDPRAGASSDRIPPLARLAQSLCLDGLRIFLPFCDPNLSRRDTGMTALMHVCSAHASGDSIACLDLLAPASNLLARSAQGFTAFDLAIRCGKNDCADHLALLMPDEAVEASLASWGRAGISAIPQWAARREATQLDEAVRLAAGPRTPQDEASMARKQSARL